MVTQACIITKGDLFFISPLSKKFLDVLRKHSQRKEIEKKYREMFL
jgi:hypothetical protein